jgi:hypothetical protein
LKKLFKAVHLAKSVLLSRPLLAIEPRIASNGFVQAPFLTSIFEANKELAQKAQKGGSSQRELLR